MTEQLQWLPFVNARLHEPFVKFIYWSLRQLDAGTQVTVNQSICRESCVQYCVAPGLALSQASLSILFTLQDFSCLPCVVHHLLFFLLLFPLSQCSGSLFVSFRIV